MRASTANYDPIGIGKARGFHSLSWWLFVQMNPYQTASKRWRREKGRNPASRLHFRCCTAAMAFLLPESYAKTLKPSL